MTQRAIDEIKRYVNDRTTLDWDNPIPASGWGNIGNGFTVPKRGILISQIRHNTANGYVYVNGIAVNGCEHVTSSETATVQVNENDRVTATSGAAIALYRVIPYKA